jgi:actin-related protein 10
MFSTSSPLSHSLVGLKAYQIDVLFSSLLADPKSRKVILVEHPVLPLYIKEMLARILFDNLQVLILPSSA